MTFEVSSDKMYDDEERRFSVFFEPEGAEIRAVKFHDRPQLAIVLFEKDDPVGVDKQAMSLGAHHLDLFMEMLTEARAALDE